MTKRQNVAERERIFADERARCRGEVALLREHAIVRRQIRETRLEKLRKSEIRRKQEEQFVNRVPLVHRIQHLANDSEAKETVQQSLNDAIRQRTSSTINRSQCPRKQQNEKRTSPSRYCIDVGIQTDADAEVKDSVPLQRPPIPHRRKPLILQTTGTSTEGTLIGSEKADLPRKRYRVPPRTRSKQKETVVFVDKSHADVEVDKSAPSRRSGLRSDRTPSRRRISKSVQRRQREPQRKPERTEEEQDLFPDAVTTAQNEVVGEERHRENDALKGGDDGEHLPCRGYEDALSEILSMDTDLFMQTYFDAPLSEISSGSDVISLEDLAALLASSSSEVDGGGAMAKTPQSEFDDSFLRMTTPVISNPDTRASSNPHVPLPWESIASETETPLVSETIVSSLESESPELPPPPETISDTSALLRGLDRVSENSLSLLSRLSSLLSIGEDSSQPDNESAHFSETTSIDTGEDLSSHGKEGSAEMRLSSSLADSLLLETILEESDESLVSISSDSISHEAISEINIEGRTETPSAFDECSSLDVTCLASDVDEAHRNGID